MLRMWSHTRMDYRAGVDIAKGYSTEGLVLTSAQAGYGLLSSLSYYRTRWELGNEGPGLSKATYTLAKGVSLIQGLALPYSVH